MHGSRQIDHVEGHRKGRTTVLKRREGRTNGSRMKDGPAGVRSSIDPRHDEFGLGAKLLMDCDEGDQRGAASTETTDPSGQSSQTIGFQTTSPKLLTPVTDELEPLLSRGSGHQHVVTVASNYFGECAQSGALDPVVIRHEHTHNSLPASSPTRGERSPTSPCLVPGRAQAHRMVELLVKVVWPRQLLDPISGPGTDLLRLNRRKAPTRAALTTVAQFQILTTTPVKRSGW